MPGFTTTDGDDWVFNFEDPVIKPELPDKPNMTTGYLEGAGKWENYSDKDLYEVDSLLRQFFESKLEDPKWTGPSTKWRRFTAGMMYEILYGVPYDHTIPGSYQKILRLARIMGYYSTRITKEGSIRGKRYKKKIYYLSINRYKKCPPYSLRLRLEWLEKQDKLPTWHNMMLPKDDLKVGHARNKRTDENMEKRRERGKKIYNERYNRKH